MAVGHVRTALDVNICSVSAVVAFSVIAIAAGTFHGPVRALAAIARTPKLQAVVCATSCSCLVIFNLRQGAESCARILTEGLGRFPVHHTTAGPAQACGVSITADIAITVGCCIRHAQLIACLF